MPPKPPNNKSKTEPGLGHAGNGNLPRMDSAEMKRVRDSFREDPDATAPTPSPSPTATGKRLRDSIRREDPDEPDTNDRRDQSSERIIDRVGTPTTPPGRGDQASRKSVSFEDSEPATGTRRKERSGRPPVTVDEVGPTAVKLARTTRRDSAPKPIGSRAMVAKAPIDTRAAFVLSLVDGRNTTDAIIDMSGMVEEEVKPILERLARLGLISLP
jgi:hypothetical protein